MSMDLGQLSQMATWLDEEHRRDKAELVRLQQRLESQEAELQDQSRLIKDLEGRLASLQTQQLRFSQLETSLKQLKEEVVQMLAQAEERQQGAERERERVRAIERDNVSKALNEIRRELQRLPRIDEELGIRKAEQRRVGESVLNVQQELNALKQEAESKLRGITFLEEGRQQDAKRIARLQQESLEAMKRIEQLGSRLQMLEGTTHRQERDTGELKELFSQLRSKQQEFVEAQLLETEQIKRHMAEWVERLEVYAKQMDRYTAQMQEYNEAFREDRQVVGNIQRFQEQIRRDQTQIAELQRLGEERQKRQLEEWQEENEKRWQKELLRWDHLWAEQGKRNQQVGERFGEAEARLSQHRSEIDAIWHNLEAQVNYQIQESRRWLGEMNQLLEQRPRKE
jgi:hypothetical protein